MGVWESGGGKMQLNNNKIILKKSRDNVYNSKDY